MPTNTSVAEPRIVFVTTCRGRVPHLRETLPRNIKDNLFGENVYRNCRFVVLSYGDDSTDLYVAQNHGPDIDSGRLAFYSVRDMGGFHVSHAKNLAARCGILEGADILVTLDADNFTGPGLAQYIAEKFNAAPQVGSGMFLCPDFPLIHSLPHGPDRPQRGYAGRLAIRANDFIKLGGYHEVFNTWYGEDIDMIARLQRLGYTMRHFPNHHLNAINHNAEVRFKEYPHAKQYENKREVKVIYARTETVVNFGKFGLGTVYRNFNSVPIELCPVPTRIFGIGLQKTGTTSLHEALGILGHDSFHWGSGEAPLIWQEMQRDGRSNTLEQWYAVCDNPIPLLYEKLDRAYPGSRFILTVRDEDKWLKSVERWWDPKYNPHRHLWDIYPFSHKIHTALYGQRTFDAQVFRERYRRHNAEVREYFKDRPRDLLVMDLEAGAGWKELCGFLSGSVPSIPYPKGNQTAPVAGFKEWVESCPPYPGDPPVSGLPLVHSLDSMEGMGTQGTALPWWWDLPRPRTAAPASIETPPVGSPWCDHHHYHRHHWIIWMWRTFWAWIVGLFGKERNDGSS